MSSGADFYVRGDVGLDASGMQQGVDEAEKKADGAAQKVTDTAKKASDTVRNEAKNAAKQVNDSVNQTGQKVQQSISAKTVAIGNLISSAVQKLVSAAVDAGKQLISTGVEYNAQIEQYGIALTTLLGSAEEANAALEAIKEDAARTPFDTASLVQANEFLIAAGENAAYSREAINALGDAIAATGGGSDELSRMAQNLQQIANAGEATAADIKQFAYAGIDVYGILADYTGKTTAEVKDMTVTYQDLTAALIQASSEGGKFYGAMDAQSETLKGRIETLKDNATQLAGALAEGLFDGEKDLVEAAIGWVDTLTQALEENGVSGMLEAAADIVQSVADGIAGNAYQAGEKAADIIAALANGVAECAPDLIAAAADTVLNFVSGIADNMDEIVSSGIDMLTSLITGILNNLPQLITAAAELIASFINAIIENLPQIVAAGAEILASLVQGITDTLTSLADVAANAVSTLKSALESNADTLKNSGSQLGQWLGEAIDSTIVSWLNTISEKVRTWAGNVKSVVNDAQAQLGIGKSSKSTAEANRLANLKGQAQTEYYKKQLAKAAAQTTEKTSGDEKTPESSIVVDPTGKNKSTKKAAQKTETTAEKAEKALKALGDSFKYTGSAAQEQASRLAALQAAYDTAATNVDKYKALLDQSNASSGAASEMSQYLAEQLDKAETEAVNARKSLDEYTDSLSGLSDTSSDAADTFSGLWDAYAKAEKQAEVYQQRLDETVAATGKASKLSEYYAEQLETAQNAATDAASALAEYTAALDLTQKQAATVAELQNAYLDAASAVETYRAQLKESIDATGEDSDESKQLTEQLAEAEAQVDAARKALDDYTGGLNAAKKASDALKTSTDKLSTAWGNSVLSKLKALISDAASGDISQALADAGQIAWQKLDTTTKQEIVDMAQGWVETLDDAFAQDGFSGLAEAGQSIAEGLLSGLQDTTTGSGALLDSVLAQLGIDGGLAGLQSTLSSLAGTIAQIAPEVLAVVGIVAAVAAAVLGVAGAFSYTVDTCQALQEKIEALTADGKQLDETVSGAIDTLQPFIDASKEMLAKLDEFTALFHDTVAGIGVELMETMIPIINEIVDILTPALEALQPALEAIGDLLCTLLDLAGTLITSVLQALQPILEAIGPLLQTLAELLNTIATIVSGVLSPAFELLGEVLNWLLTPIKWLAEAIHSIFSGLISLINSVLQALNQIEIFGWHPFNFKTISTADGSASSKGTAYNSITSASTSSSSKSSSSKAKNPHIITGPQQPLDEVDRYARMIQDARDSAAQNMQETAGSVANTASAARRTATYTIIVPVQIDGQEFARVTAPYIDEELEFRQ